MGTAAGAAMIRDPTRQDQSTPLRNSGEEAKLMTGKFKLKYFTIQNP